jgi:hypothetical protein
MTRERGMGERGLRQGAAARGASAALLLALVLGGCSSLPFSKPAEAPATDPNALPAQYRAEVAAFLRTYLNNPTKVRDAYISPPTLKPYGGATRFVSCVRYDPRDTRNQYMGNEDRIAIFWGGRLNQFLPGNAEFCAGANYERFPEAEVLVP